MFVVKKYLNNNLKNYLINSNKNNIFKSGSGGGLHLSAYSNIYDYSVNEINHLVYFNLKTLEEFNIKNINHVFVEHRDYVMKKEDTEFTGKLHIDSFMDSGDPCWTSIYYYKIDSGIIGGDLVFPPFGKYLPKEDDIIYFDGDIKHYVGSLKGHGTRGIVINQFKKIE